MKHVPNLKSGRGLICPRALEWRLLKGFIIAVIVIAMSSCQKTTPGRDMEGVWQSVGHGWVLEIRDSLSYGFFDITDNSCLLSRKAPLDELMPSLRLEGDTLYLKRGILRYPFIRLENLPESCRGPLTPALANDPIYNFDVFAQTVTEHYVFRKLNHINWDSLRREQRGKLTASSADTALYRVLDETLTILKDNHAFLEATDKVYEELSGTSTVEVQPIPDSVALTEYGDFQVAAMVARHHLAEELTEDSWLIQWGWMADSTAFVQIKAMWLYADLEIPEALIEENGYVDAYVDTFHTMDEGMYIRKEVAGVRNIMARVMDDLGGAPRMVLDVRFNGGGQDAVSFEILRHFNDRRRLVALEQVKSGDSLTPKQGLYLQASAKPYLKPVYILTSPQTGSAAEAFTLASRSLPHVKRIGSPTSGALSTALEKQLPNGWKFSISNELFMDTEGVYYENKGVPADYHLKYAEDRQSFFRAVVEDLGRDYSQIQMAIRDMEH